MRPSNEPGVVFVLDTLGECRVVNNALQDISKPDKDTAELEAVLPPDFKERFDNETRHWAPYGKSEGGPAWNKKPEFRVRAEDVNFVIEAARLIDKGSCPWPRGSFALFGQISAADNILESVGAPLNGS